MNDIENIKLPAILPEIQAATDVLGFRLSCEKLTGVLLRSLAATKPGGMFLELGTGTGVSTAWLLDGMDRNSKLITVEQNTSVVAIAQKYLGNDPRVTFHIEDASLLISDTPPLSFDFIFADAWTGKYSHLSETLKLLKVGGIFVIDDMVPHENWPENHAPKVSELIGHLEERNDLAIAKLSWSSGIIIAAKIA